MTASRRSTLKVGLAGVAAALAVGGVATIAVAGESAPGGQGTNRQPDHRYTVSELDEATETITGAADARGWPVTAVSHEPDRSGLIVEVVEGAGLDQEIADLVDVPVRVREVPAGDPIPRPVTD